MCVLSGRGLCDELITRPEDSYQLWRFDVRSRNFGDEEATARAGLQCQIKSIISNSYQVEEEKEEQKYFFL
jgi:hypothetical protein